MKKILFFGRVIAFLLISLAFFSCDDCITGNGNMTEKAITIGEISKIRLSADAEVILVADSSNQLKIEAESNIIDAYEFNESGKALKISTRQCIIGHENVKITIPVRTLESLSINGSGNIVGRDPMRAMALELNVNGSGDISLNVEADNIVSKINGSGDIELKGSAKSQRIAVNGSGNFESKELAAGKVKITINGSGDCRVMATSALNVIVRGSGNVYYSGSPDVSTEIKGSGSVQKME